ncbi:MAG: hypothetical protein AB2A00_22900 [Myxococcota bacterium]
MSDGRGVGGGGGFGAGIQRLLRQGAEALQKKDTKETKESKDSKSADGKGDVKGGSSAGGAGGVRAKGKAKGKDMGAIGALIGGSDAYTVENEEKERRRKQRAFLGEPEEGEFAEMDSTQDKSAVAHISAEFRAQVAAGMVAGRSFTQGSCLVPENVESDDDDDDEDERPRKKKRR